MSVFFVWNDIIQINFFMRRILFWKRNILIFNRAFILTWKLHFFFARCFLQSFNHLIILIIFFKTNLLFRFGILCDLKAYNIIIPVQVLLLNTVNILNFNKLLALYFRIVKQIRWVTRTWTQSHLVTLLALLLTIN